MDSSCNGPLNWIEAVPGQMPEDMLKHRHYRLWGQDREATPYVLVCREHRERPDCAMRVHIEGQQWAWSDGDGITRVTHWAVYNRAVPWDEDKHKRHTASLRIQRTSTK